MKKLFVTIMRAQRNYGDIDFEVVDFVDHAVLLVDAAAPCFFKLEVAQVLHLPCACARMFLQFKQQVGNLIKRLLVATLLDGGKLSLRLFRKKNNVGHRLEGVDKSAQRNRPYCAHNGTAPVVDFTTLKRYL